MNKTKKQFLTELEELQLRIADLERREADNQQTEQALRESEEKYRALVENSIEGIAISKGNRIISGNRAVLDIFGYDTFEEFSSKPLLDSVAPESKNFILDRIKKRAQGESLPARYEYKIVRKDGEIRDLEISASVVTLKNEEYILGTFRDITDKKHSQEIIRKSEQKYRTLVELTSDIIHVADENGIATYVNDAAYKILGMVPDEIIGKPFINLVYPEDRKKTQKVFKDQIKKRKDVFNYENRLVTKSGEVIHVLHNIRVLHDTNSTIIGTQGIARNITDQKMAIDEINKHRQELQRLSTKVIDSQEEERKRITLELHDELGQTLTAISINLNDLKHNIEPHLTPETKSKLEEVITLLNHTHVQIRELASELRPSLLDELGLLPALNWLVRKFKQRVNIEVSLLTKEINKRLNPKVETALYRIIQEALTNVAKHSKAKSVRINLRYYNSTIFVTVEDDGRGINEASKKSIEKGIGLLGMEERVKQLGGSFSIQSPVNEKGTRIKVKIPYNT